MSSYPGALDTFINPTTLDRLDTSTVTHRLQHGNINDAVLAIETELGLLPKGTSATVRARLDGVDAAISGFIGGYASLTSANTFTASPQQITVNAAGNKGLIVKGAASQTANLQEWQNSGGTALASVGFDGRTIFPYLGVGDAASIPMVIAQATILSNATTRIGLIVRGAASQTANLQEWQNSAGTVLVNIDAPNSLTSGVGAFLRFTDAGVGGIKWGGNIVFGLGEQSLTTAILYPYAASYKGLVIQGKASQTANLQEWQDSTGTVLANVSSVGDITVANSIRGASIALRNISSGGSVFIDSGTGGSSGSILFRRSSGYTETARFDANGLLLVNSTSATLGGGSVASQLGIVSAAATNVGAVIRGATSQTGNLQEWQNSGGTVLASVRYDGLLFVPVSTAGQSYINGYFSNVQSAVTTQATNYVGLVIQGVASQTADLQQWQNSAGSVLAHVDAFGSLYLAQIGSRGGTGAYFGLANADAITINTNANTNKGLIVKGAASQTANLQEWQNSAGTVVSSVRNDGVIVATTGLLASGAAVWAGSYIANTQLASIPNSATVVGAIIRGAASQTANLQEWQNSAGTSQVSIGPAGDVSALGSIYTSNAYFGGGASYYNATINIRAQQTSYKGIVIRGLASQTGNLQEWQDSAGTVLSYIDSAGNMNFSGTGSFVQSSTGRALFVVNGTTNVPIIVKGAVSQAANLQEWQDSAGIVKASIAPSGLLSVAETANGTALSISQNSGGRTMTFSNSGFIMNSTVAYGVSWNNIAHVEHYSSLSSRVVSMYRAISTQTADIIQYQNSSGTVLGGVNAAGQFYAGSTTSVFGSGTTALTSAAYTSATVAVFTYAGTSLVQLGQSVAVSGVTGGTYNGTWTVSAVTSTTFTVLGSGFTNVAGSGGTFQLSAVGSFIGGTTAITPLVVQGSATAYLQEWQNAGGGFLAGILGNGGIRASQARIGTAGSLGTLTVSTTAAATIGAVIQGVASQTANLQEWQNSAGTVLASVSNAGDISAKFIAIAHTNAAQIALDVLGAPSQTADLQWWRNNAGTVLSGVNAAGQYYAGSPTSLISSATTALTSAAYTSATVAVFTYAGTSLVQLGQSVAVSGVTGGTYNGTWIVTATTSTTFTVLGSGFTNIAGTGGTFALSPSGSFYSPTSPTTALLVRGSASMTAYMLEIQNVSGTLMGGWDANGVLRAAQGSVIDVVGASGASAVNTLWATNTSGSITIGAGLTNGTLTIAGGTGVNGSSAVNIVSGSTVSYTLNIATGVTSTTNTKTINIGTLGATGSTTSIAIGSTTGTSTTVVNGTLQNGLIAAGGTGVTANIFHDVTTGTVAVGSNVGGGGTLSLASNTSGSLTISIGMGSTTSGNTKTIGLGNWGLAGSTTNIIIGSATGTSTTTINGIAVIGGTTIPAATTFVTQLNLQTQITNGITSLPAAALPSAGTITTAAQIGYMGMPQNLNPGAYTITAADDGKHLYYTTTAQTVTIPANATLALPIGFSFAIVNATGVTTSIAITTDTLLLAGVGTTGTRTLAAFGMATALKITATTWIISGNGLT